MRSSSKDDDDESCLWGLVWVLMVYWRFVGWEEDLKLIEEEEEEEEEVEEDGVGDGDDDEDEVEEEEEVLESDEW